MISNEMVLIIVEAIIIIVLCVVVKHNSSKINALADDVIQHDRRIEFTLVDYEMFRSYFKSLARYLNVTISDEPASVTIVKNEETV